MMHGQNNIKLDNSVIYVWDVCNSYIIKAIEERRFECITTNLSWKIPGHKSQVFYTVIVKNRLWLQ
jgi:hypothetical protein